MPENRGVLMDRSRLYGNVAVITGAAGSIGFPTAIALAQAGADAALADGGHQIW